MNCKNTCAAPVLAGLSLFLASGGVFALWQPPPGELRKFRAASAARRQAAAAPAEKRAAAPRAVPVPGGRPDYFNYPNFAYSPPIRKFVDTLPGVGPANANNLGHYIPVATKDQAAFSGSDYYRIGLAEYTQKLHTDLPATKLRGYKDLAGGDGSAHYLGPLIIAQRGRPVRLKFSNLLPTGAPGDLFLPVDTTIMGAGEGPLHADGSACDPETETCALYTQNRATVHLHGGDSPWISDGTPHQWITPSGESTPYARGVSAVNVPDMPDPGAGALTFYYPNEQSSRLMFYHDHSFGITRLNVYAGEAAGYLLTDAQEEGLIDSGVLPNAGGDHRYGIPLIIQDKTFVPGPAQLAAQDPTWDSARWGGQGSLWFPHVYQVGQDPTQADGLNPTGRWDYGPWAFSQFVGVEHPDNPDGTPGTPDVSAVPEAFMDTPLVNGTPYPALAVQRKAYRFRVLNAANDRFLNLQLYYADPLNPTEVKMVPAVSGPTIPAHWPFMDGRPGGVPDPATVGPDIVQLGNEAGLLPAPVVLRNTPIGFDLADPFSATIGNVKEHTLLLAPAERADIVIDFSQVPDGSRLILYNDAPAAFPGPDPRYDLYTGGPDQTALGGPPSTAAGFGPNTRTIMRFQVSGVTADPAYNLAALQAALPAAFAASQPAAIVPAGIYGHMFDSTLTFSTATGASPVAVPFRPKVLAEGFELGYGRIEAKLGLELPLTHWNMEPTLRLGNVDPVTEVLKDGEIQLWKIGHFGVDTHPIHFHAFNVQLVNRVDWGGLKKAPEPNELGWKETIRMNPLEHVIVAMKPKMSAVPFQVPRSVRPLNPTAPLGSRMGFSKVDSEGKTADLTNVMTDFAHEYVWHCHILGHEENDMMRPLVLMMAPTAPSSVAALPGDRRATVSFAPGLTGGGDVTYTAVSSPGGLTVSGTSSPIVVNGLNNGVPYTFTVTASNASGTAVSAPCAGVTPDRGADLPLSVLSVSPPGALYGGGDVLITVSGFGFLPGATVKLMREGETDVFLENVNVQNYARLTGVLRSPLIKGKWSVVVSSGAATGVLGGAFSLASSPAGGARVFRGLFNPARGEGTTLASSLVSPGQSTIRIYDSEGRFVREIYRGFRAAGEYMDTWDGRNADGAKAASGVYLVRFECPGFKETKRVVLVK